MKFELNNARRDVRCATHMAERLGVPTVMGEATHQSLVLACALGFGNKPVPPLVEAQEKLANVKIVPKRTADREAGSAATACRCA